MFDQNTEFNYGEGSKDDPKRIVSDHHSFPSFQNLTVSEVKVGTIQKNMETVLIVYRKIIQALTRELNGTLSGPELTPVAFHIDFKDKVSGEEEISCVLINGTIASRMINLSRNNVTILNYAFRVGRGNSEVARGLFKIRVSVK